MRKLTIKKGIYKTDVLIDKYKFIIGNNEIQKLNLKRALKEFLIEGIDTTIPFHLRVLDNEEFKKGTIYTNFIETHFKDTLNK